VSGRHDVPPVNEGGNGRVGRTDVDVDCREEPGTGKLGRQPASAMSRDPAVEFAVVRRLELEQWGTNAGFAYHLSGQAA
jgi:hypothetical protein